MRGRVVGSVRASLMVGLTLGACAGPIPPSPVAESSIVRPSETALPDPTAAPVGTPTVVPLTDPTPAYVLEPPEPTATSTPVPVPGRLPLERVAILQPGPGSQVRSPFRVIGRAGPSYQNRVRIRLLGEDGRVMAQRTASWYGPEGSTGSYVADLEFATDAVAEAGRLEVSSFDTRTGRLDHLTTQDLILLSVGQAIVHPALDGPDRLSILAPRQGAAVAGGQVLVQGAGWASSDAPLTLVLIDRLGNALASVETTLNSSRPQELGTFEGALSYQVAYPQFARLAIFEPSPDGAELLHYSSIEVYLRP